jgi:hypothetical protein
MLSCSFKAEGKRFMSNFQGYRKETTSKIQRVSIKEGRE